MESHGTFHFSSAAKASVRFTRSLSWMMEFAFWHFCCSPVPSSLCPSFCLSCFHPCALVFLPVSFFVAVFVPIGCGFMFTRYFTHLPLLACLVCFGGVCLHCFSLTAGEMCDSSFSFFHSLMLSLSVWQCICLGRYLAQRCSQQCVCVRERRNQAITSSEMHVNIGDPAWVGVGRTEWVRHLTCLPLTLFLPSHPTLCVWERERKPSIVAACRMTTIWT